MAARTGRRRQALLALAVFALVVLAAPVLHHDLACHVKTPLHCHACVAKPLASRAEAAFGTEALGLRPLAGVATAEPRVVPCLPAASRPGRAPPA